MSRNTNRDYLIIVDVKSSAIKEFNKLEFYINDKESHNIFVQLVVKESQDIINKYTSVDDPNLYELTMNIVKPTNEHKRITGKLISLEDGLYEFKLPQDCCDKVGTYKCELETLYNSRITNSNRIKYRIKKSVLNDLDGVVDAPGYPIVIQLLDKLSDIEQYEEDRRANELARQLAEEQRQARFNALDADITNSIQAIDDKVVDVENRIVEKEEAVDTLIVNTKADIDGYKKAKDQEIDEYKTTKDTEINNAITAQDNKIDIAISEQNDRIAVVENNVVAQNNRLDIVENKNTQQDNKLDVVEAKNVEQDNRLNEIEAIDVAQNNRLDAIEIKNQQQDDRLLNTEKVNKRQDMDLKCLFAESKNNMIDVTEEGNSIYLQNSTVGYTLIDEIQGQTLVNCNKEPDKEIILNGNINTQGYSNVTLTEGVDGGLVDVALEGNTLVNVSKTKDSTALPLEEELTYLYANTQYTVQFISDVAIAVDITLGGTSLLAQSIVKGLNRISITTPATLTDNKLVISGVGAKISEVVVTDSNREFGYFEGMKSVGECEYLEVVSSNSDGTLSNTQTLTHEPLRSVADIKDKYVLIDGKWYIERNCGVRAYQEGDIDNYITDKINTVYPLSTPTYEPIDYSPLAVYSNTTHISNNSTIPCNMTIKNTGYNCLLKPNTTYTVSSNLGLNVVTTPSVLSEDCLRFYDTDTSDVTTMKNVMVLEGDYTTGKPLPSHFSGIESAFEQEYDEAVGKYKIKIRVQNEDASKENYIEFYIDEPLRGIGNIKDKVYVKDDKVVVERNCGSVTFDGSDDENVYPVYGSIYNNKCLYNAEISKLGVQGTNLKSNTLNTSNGATEYYDEGIYLFNDNVRFIINARTLNNIYTTSSFKQWLQQNPVTVVYQLAEPAYEEVEYNDTKLFIESFKNSTLSYNSNVPVTSKVYYSYSVPIVDTVAQTANVTDEQDSMIIDLTTQVAVMEMMLM